MSEQVYLPGSLGCPPPPSPSGCHRLHRPPRHCCRRTKTMTTGEGCDADGKGGNCKERLCLGR